MAVIRESEYPMLLFEQDGAYWIQTRDHKILARDKIEEIAPKLVEFVREHEAEIDEKNSREIEAPARWTEDGKLNKLTKPVKVKSLLYLLECGGKYKIGVSKDVTRRMKELDTRPFELSLVCCSKPFYHAYEAEELLHRTFRKQRIVGEWFELDDKDISRLMSYYSTVDDNTWSRKP